MNIIKTAIDGIYILEPKVFGDNRGWFMESYSEKTMKEYGFDYNFVQDNHSFSAVKGTLRGIHFQKGNSAQAKLVRCCKGAVLDKADNYYDAANDRSILWCDEEIGVKWNIDNPIISEKDSRAPKLRDSDVDFKY